jgi:hypothetical protein
MINEGDCGVIGGMKFVRGNRTTRRKPVPAPLCPPHIPLDQTRARTRTAAVGSQRLTAWAMARPIPEVCWKQNLVTPQWWRVSNRHWVRRYPECIIKLRTDCIVWRRLWFPTIPTRACSTRLWVKSWNKRTGLAATCLRVSGTRMT